MQKRHLILMRHATAGSGGGRDHERRLTARGLDEAHRVGVALASAGPVPDHVLCSSAIRCRETWDAVRAGLGLEARSDSDAADSVSTDSVSTDFEKDLYNASADEILRVLAGASDARSVLLLAHNPGVSMMALELARGSDVGLERMRSGFTPASIACFEIEGDWSSLSATSASWLRFERGPSA